MAYKIYWTSTTGELPNFRERFEQYQAKHAEDAKRIAEAVAKKLKDSK